MTTGDQDADDGLAARARPARHGPGPKCQGAFRDAAREKRETRGFANHVDLRKTRPSWDFFNKKKTSKKRHISRWFAPWVAATLPLALLPYYFIFSTVRVAARDTRPPRSVSLFLDTVWIYTLVILSGYFFFECLFFLKAASRRPRTVRATRTSATRSAAAGVVVSELNFERERERESGRDGIGGIESS